MQSKTATYVITFVLSNLLNITYNMQIKPFRCCKKEFSENTKSVNLALFGRHICELLIQPLTSNHDKNFWNCQGEPNKTTWLTVCFSVSSALQL